MSKSKKNTKAGEQGPSWRVRAEEVSLLGRELAEQVGGVASVVCPKCHSKGRSCVRPSDHKASDYHRERKDAFDLMVWESYITRFQALAERWQAEGWTPEGPHDMFCPACCAPPTMECVDAIPSEPTATHEHLGLHVARVNTWLELTGDAQEEAAEPRAAAAGPEAGARQEGGRSSFKAVCDCGFQSMPGPSGQRAASSAKRHKCWQTCRLIEYDPATQKVLNSHVVVTGTPGQEPKRKHPVSTAPKRETVPAVPAPAKVEPQRTLAAWGVFG